MRVLKRKKGNGKFFYIQHSYRDQAKVITKEKYLGKEIPKEVGRIKADFEKECQTIVYKKIYKKLKMIKKNFQKEWRRIPRSGQDREMEEIAIAFTYNTNAIEGSTLTLAETRQVIQDSIASHKPMRDIKETESHSRIFLEMIKQRPGLSERLLLHWHKNIFENTKPDIAGFYRTYFVRVGDYIPPDGVKVQSAMKELLKLIKKHKKTNPVELAGRAHYKFEKIHPFWDGNGRIGRLLMNHILWTRGYPMIIIERTKRSAYFKALQRREEGFVRYFMRMYLKVHRNRYF